MKRLALCLVLLSAALSASDKIDFNGSLRSASGFEPKVSFQPEYSGYKNRKVLHLKSDQQIVYDLSKLTTDKQNAVRFSLKADSVAPDSLVPLLRYASTDGTLQVFVGIKRKALVLIGNESQINSTSEILSPGSWLRISFLQNSEDSMPLLKVNEKLVHLHPVQLPPFANPRTKDSLLLSSSDGFSWRIKNLEIGKNLPVEKPEEDDIPLVWAAKDLPHFAGKQTIDKTAQQGSAWTTDSLLAEDRARLPAAGNYELTWRIKRIAASPAGILVSNIYDGEKILVSGKKEARSLTGQKYDRFVVPFKVASAISIRYTLASMIPIKHSILADSVILRNTNTGWQSHRQIEDAHRTMGMVKEDPKAENGKAIDNENTLTYGPYICLGQPGKYRVTWRIKLSGRIPERTAVLLLNVYAHDGLLTPSRRGNKSYGDLALNSESFTTRDSWQTKSIDFQYDGADMMEFRTFTRLFQPGDVLLDTITVEKVRGD